MPAAAARASAAASVAGKAAKRPISAVREQPDAAGAATATAMQPREGAADYGPGGPRTVGPRMMGGGMMGDGSWGGPMMGPMGGGMVGPMGGQYPMRGPVRLAPAHPRAFRVNARHQSLRLLEHVDW